MSSGQASGGGSMMDKIQMVDPMNALAPMRSVEQQGPAPDDREKSVSEAVKEEVDKRMEKAQRELQAKYARDGKGMDSAGGDGPTGAAYTQAAVAERERRRGVRGAEAAAAAEAEERDFLREVEVRRQVADEGSDDEDGDGEQEGAEEEEEVDSDDEYLNDLEGDPEIARIRAARLHALKAESLTRQQLQRDGHGLLSEIVQDEFLPRITKAKQCVVHFYHNDFHRCKIMDRHLEIIAEHHMETLFLKINAEKAPFFCTKLDVVVLPTVICFFEGKTNPAQRQIGFIDLEPVPGGGEDEWPTTALQAKLGACGAINYVARATDEEKAKYGLLAKNSITATKRVSGRDECYDE